jgi:hypothetical protein
LIVTDEAGTEMLYGVLPSVNVIADCVMFTVTGVLPTPDTFITAVNQMVDPAAIAVPLKFAAIDESQDEAVDSALRGPREALLIGIICCPCCAHAESNNANTAQTATGICARNRINCMGASDIKIFGSAPARDLEKTIARPTESDTRPPSKKGWVGSVLLYGRFWLETSADRGIQRAAMESNPRAVINPYENMKPRDSVFRETTRTQH